jgi:hypothetical protein
MKSNMCEGLETPLFWQKLTIPIDNLVSKDSSQKPEKWQNYS